MKLTIQPESAESFRQRATWRYEPPFDFYDGDIDPVLNPERFFEALAEDGSLVGNASVVLHRAVVRTGALVGSNAVVPNGMEVPSGAMALGIPAQIKEGKVQPGQFEHAAALYAANGQRYKQDLRRLD